RFGYDSTAGCTKSWIPRPQRASMQDLYDRMEICQEAIERMEYREPTTHLVMLSRSMTSIIGSTNLHHSIHRSSSSSRNDYE
ncbi:hypothetical protein Tco_1324736, partial [Tanacetum coccineum]